MKYIAEKFEFPAEWYKEVRYKKSLKKDKKNIDTNKKKVYYN